MKNKIVLNLTLSALFLAVGIILPFFTGQIPQIGNMLLPMHIPVLLCGFICGWRYGAAVGLILPILRFALFRMPPIYPVGLAMTFELAAYGAVVGFCHTMFPKKKMFLFISLIVSMLAGRTVWGVVMLIISGVSGGEFTWQIFISSAVLNAVPGIVLQIVFIPAIMITLQKTGVLPENGKLPANVAAKTK